jgi:hypothetical protein
MRLTPLLLCLLLLGSTARAGDQVQLIDGRDYAAVLRDEIGRARKSITACLYLVSLNLSRAGSGPLRVVDALAAAKARGVKVEVILDGERDWADGGEELPGGRNRTAYDYLAAKGLDVYLSTVPAIVHAKAVVFDESSVLMGSTNWTESAFSHNVEANLLVRDPFVARQTLALIQRAGRRRLPPVEVEAAKLPVAFLAGPLAAFVHDQHGRVFDTYLWLLRAAGDGREVVVDYDVLARELGMEKVSPGERTHSIRGYLNELRKAGFISYTPPGYGEKPRAGLVPQAGDTVGVPAAYWDFGWSRSLPVAGKAMYFIGRYRSARSPMRPRWSASRDTLSRETGLKLGTISKGTVALRRANLVEVEYDDLDMSDGRGPSIYTPNALYDPSVLAAAVEKLEQAHGPDTVARARRCAALVLEDSDVSALENFIQLEKDFGPARVEEIYQVLAKKKPDNPKRSLGYFIGAVRGKDIGKSLDPR